MLGECLLSQSLGQMPPAPCCQRALGIAVGTVRGSPCVLCPPCKPQDQTTTSGICQRCFRWSRPLLHPMSLFCTFMGDLSCLCLLLRPAVVMKRTAMPPGTSSLWIRELPPENSRFRLCTSAEDTPAPPAACVGRPPGGSRDHLTRPPGDWEGLGNSTKQGDYYNLCFELSVLYS